MKNGQSEKPQKGRRFCEKTDGEMIRKYFAKMPTAELAGRMWLTVRQITNYVYRHNITRGQARCEAVPMKE